MFLATFKVHPVPLTTLAQAPAVYEIAPLGVSVMLAAAIDHAGVPVNAVELMVKFRPVAPWRSVHQKLGQTHVLPDIDHIEEEAVMLPRLIPVAVVQLEIVHEITDNDNCAVCALV